MVAIWHSSSRKLSNRVTITTHLGRQATPGAKTWLPSARTTRSCTAPATTPLATAARKETIIRTAAKYFKDRALSISGQVFKTKARVCWPQALKDRTLADQTTLSSSDWLGSLHETKVEQRDKLAATPATIIIKTIHLLLIKVSPKSIWQKAPRSIEVSFNKLKTTRKAWADPKWT